MVTSNFVALARAGLGGLEPFGRHLERRTPGQATCEQKTPGSRGLCSFTTGQAHGVF